MQENNKRIAKNTLFLYFRMLITMGVSLYTSRVVLATLGVEDYGIYSVVGGIVAMFGFLNSTLASGTQRFLTFQLGKNNFTELKKTFSAALNIHILLAIVILILAETIGLWFLKAKINIPDGREYAALWVYQFSVLAALLSIVQVPYNASIIAHERMNIYAYVSIIDVVLKLLIVYLLSVSSYDKLITYAVLIFVVSVIVMGIYGIYCKKQYPECRFGWVKDKPLYQSMLIFSGWNIFGSFSWMTLGAGLNILLNVFFGASVNAARGIAFTVQSAVMSFVNNFRTAINPQIIKSYAVGNETNMLKLLINGSKYTYYLMFFLSLPILLETERIIGIWLKTVPEYTVIFCQLILINSLIQCFDASLGIIFQATGKVKENQIFSGGLYLLVLPISYFLLKLSNNPPQIVFVVQIIITVIVSFVVKIILINKIINISLKEYWQKLIFPVSKVSVIAIIVPLLIRYSLPETVWRLLWVALFSFLSIGITIYCTGVNKIDRERIKKYFVLNVQRYIKHEK